MWKRKNDIKIVYTPSNKTYEELIQEFNDLMHDKDL